VTATEVTETPALLVETIIFDLDGVLLDSGRDIANAANYTLAALDLEPLPMDLVASYIGGGAEPLLRRCLGAKSAELFDQALPLFKRRYAEYCIVESMLYQGVRELLAQCQARHIRMAIATNKSEAITTRILEAFGIAEYFEAIVGPERVARRKPDPEALQIILTALRAVPRTTIMIGDTEGDILAGKNAGCLTCGVTYGFGTIEEVASAGPDLLIRRPSELLLFVKPTGIA
jgi:phosphoglycolate phosphatase